MVKPSKSQTQRTSQPSQITIGLDIGDTYTHFCVLDAQGDVLEEGRFRTTPVAAQHWLTMHLPARVVMEIGTHSPWLSRLTTACGHETIVANPRRVRLIAASDTKTDRQDAECLARLGRLDPQLLSPIVHRSEHAQVDLTTLRSRDVLVRSRTQLVNHVRGTVKALGGRLPTCSTPSFVRQVTWAIPDALRSTLAPVLQQIDILSATIKQYDKTLTTLADAQYPETLPLRQVPGVGPITALCFVLTLEDPARFATSRAVGAYLGLRPKQRDSGARTPQLRITKAGDVMLRRLLVGSAQYILGPFGPDTDLRRWGTTIASRGGKNAKKRAVVAVARKLAGLLHHLWVTGETYVPRRMPETPPMPVAA